MKKSNIFLIIAISMAFCWTVIIGWFAASAINNHHLGKELVFARTHRQYLESRKKSFPVPSNELCITGEGTAVLTIIPGKVLSVLSDARIWSSVFTDQKNGKSIISLRKLKPYDDPVTITLPDIPALTLVNCSDVTLKGMDQEKIHIQGKQCSSLTLSSCSFGILELDFPGERVHRFIWIAKSNKLDVFKASVKGFGRIRLETAGRTQNQLSLSDSVIIEAGSDLIGKLFTNSGYGDPEK